MAYDTDRQSDIGGAAAVILVALILGLLVLAVGGCFFLRASQAERQMVMARTAAMASQKRAERLRFEAELDRDQLLAEADLDNADSVNGRQITIAIDQEGNASVDGKLMQPDELQHELRTMIDESRSQLSVVVQVDDRCLFKHVAEILSLCEEAGIEISRLTASDQ